MDLAKVRIPYALSWIVAALMAATSIAGIAAPGIYRDADWIRATWFGNDLVTLLVAAPLLVAALLGVRRGSRLAELTWYAVLAYDVYGYAYYLHGALINELFPAFAVLVTAAAFALAMALHRADATAIARAFSPKTPARTVAAYLVFTGTGLMFAWVGQWAALVFGGRVPDIGEGPFQLVASLDLTIIVPLMVVSGVLLWHRAAWGFVLGAMMVIKGMTYTFVLTVNSTVATLRGIEGFEGQIPVWGAWTLVGAVAAFALLKGLLAPARDSEA